MTTRKSSTRLHQSDRITIAARTVDELKAVTAYKVRPAHLPDFARSHQFVVSRALSRRGGWVLTHVRSGFMVPGSHQKTRDDAILRGIERLYLEGSTRYAAAIERAMAKVPFGMAA